VGRRVAVERVESQVRERRVAAGLSQQELAERAGLTRQAVSAIEAGRYLPNTAVALRLARALGCPVEELFRLPDVPPRVRADLVGDVSADDRRGQGGRVGGRLLARALAGASGPPTPADGLLVGAAPGGRGAMVDLLVDPEVVERTVVVLGCDPALALLSAHLSRRYPNLRLLWTHAGSLAALRGLARGEAHAAGTHLRDPETGEFNLPFVRRELAGRRLHVVTLTEWQQGLIVARGNPRGIAGPTDLARPDITIVNREPGSGSRAMLDAALRAAGVTPEQVRGYARELPTHLAVAEAVASGAADVGPGIAAAARALGLEFIPLQEERYDLVIPTDYIDAPAVQALLETAVHPAYRAEVEALGGYDSSRAGSIVAELGA